MITGRALGSVFVSRFKKNKNIFSSSKCKKKRLKPDSFHFYMIITIGIVGLGGHS